MYVNSSLAKVEALKAGYDEAILLAPDGHVSECTGENIFIVRDGVHPHPADLGRRRAGRASPRTRSRPSPRDLGYEVRHEPLIRTDLYLADEAFLTGTAAEVVPIRAVDDRPVGHGQARARSPRRSSRPTSPPCGARSTATRTGSTMSTDADDATAAGGAAPHAHGHGAHALRPLPDAARGGRHLRHHAARRHPAGGAVAHRRRQAAGGRAARPPRRRLHRGRLARRQPQGRGVLRPGPDRAAPATATLVAFGSTRRAGVEAARTTTSCANLVEAGTAGRSASWPSRWDRHVTEALRTTLDEAVAMVADSVALPAARTTCGCSSTPSTSSTATATTPTSPCGCSARPRRRAPRRSCSATPTAASLPDDVGAVVADVRGRTRARSSASTSTTTPAAPWPTPSPRSRPAPPRCRAASTATASGPATPTSRPPSPTCRSSCNIRTIPADRLERLTPVSHHIAELVNIAPNPQQPYVGASAFAHKAGLHASAVARRARPLRARRARPGRQRHPGRRLGDGRPLDPGHEGGRARARPRRRGRCGRVLDELKRLEHEGYHFEVADGSLELLLRRADRLGAATSSSRVLPGHHRPRAARRAGRRRSACADRLDRASPPRRRSRSTSAPSASSPPPRATARSTPSTRRSRQAIGAASRRSAAIHLTDYRVRVLDTGRGHRGGDPGPRRHRRRRADLDHHRGLGEHHRGQLAGPLRLDRLRSVHAA